MFFLGQQDIEFLIIHIMAYYIYIYVNIVGHDHIHTMSDLKILRRPQSKNQKILNQ